MAHELRRKVLICSAVTVLQNLLFAQGGGRGGGDQVPRPRPGDLSKPRDSVELPDPPPKRSSRDIVKDHKKNLEDLDKLAALVKQLREDLEKTGPHALSAPAVRSADQMQKLAKTVNDRLKQKD